MDLTKLAAYLGWPSGILIAAALVDYYTNEDGKNAIVQFFKSDLTDGLTEEATKLFFNNFLVRLLDFDIGSTRFFLRSCMFTVLSIAIVMILQLISTDTTQIESIRQMYFEVGYVSFIVMVIVNCFIDYFSNIVSFVLIKAASGKSKTFDLSVIIAADISLTITLFTLLFPYSLIAGLETFRAQNPLIRGAIIQQNENIIDVFRNDIKLDNNNYSINLFNITSLNIEETRTNTTTAAVIVWRNNSVNPFNAGSLIAEQLSGGVSDRVLSFNTTDGKYQGTWANTDYPKLADIFMIAPTYSGFFASTESLRSAFTTVIEFIPIVFHISSIYENIIPGILRGQNVTIICNSHVEKHITMSGGKNIFNEVVSRATSECGDGFLTAFMIDKGENPTIALRMVASGWIQIPTSLFFLASMFIPAIFYFSVIVLIISIYMKNFYINAFGWKYARTKDFPFTFLALPFFITLEILHIFLMIITK